MPKNNMPSIEREKPREEEEAKQEEQKKTFGEDPTKIKVELEKPEKPRYMPDGADDFMKRFMELGYEIKAYENKVFGLTTKDNAINKRAEEIKSRVYLNVYNEKGEDTKKYFGAAQIEEELKKRLPKTDGYKDRFAELYKEVAAEGDGTGKGLFSSEKAKKDETNLRVNKDTKIGLLKDNLRVRIAKETEPGKQLYGNDQIRNIETDNRMQRHAEYQVLMNAQADTMRELNEMKTQVSCLRYELKSSEMAIEYLKIKLRIL